MASLKQHPSRVAHINDRTIDVLPGETVLQAALRNGMAFPNGCRVGACAACKCQLLEGKVKELTETGYLLSEEDIAQGAIRACQSVPRSDVRVAVTLAEEPARPRVRGAIIEQRKLTHDITHLTVQLARRLDYRAGQFANLSLDSMPDLARSYSFASPARADGQVSFTIRKVPGGRLSTRIHDTELVGQEVHVDGPHGDFWLRPAKAPLLMIAGGSGLAPILAMLEEEASRGGKRDVTLLFGARAERDLHALDRIAALLRGWQGSFRFVPVLSDEPGAAWTGERGLVTDRLPELLEPGAHAYLCGPPGMIDRALEVLRAHGVPREHVHFDRFTTLADQRATAPELAARTLPSRVVSALHYLKYFAFHAIGLFSAAAIVAGGRFVTASLLSVLTLYILGDALAGDDTSTPHFRRPAILTVQLWLALPLLSLIVFASVWSVCPGDPLGFGSLIKSLTGFDALAARAATGVGHHVSAWLLTGLMIGMVGTIPAHELTHRTWDRVSMLVGR